MTAKGVITIGLALSGGGVRAAVFHLGVLARLAADRLLEEVTFLSTVSGGSMAIGLVYTLAGNRWPGSADYAARVLPAARRPLTRASIQRDVIVRSLRQPWLLARGQAKVVSASMQQCWGMGGMLKDLATEPRWVINATTYETGKNWRFMPQRMGDYVVGYVREPAIALADAVAASAAFPALVGPLVLRPAEFAWWQYADGASELTAAPSPALPRLHLWDGGVYDNLGVEPLFKPNSDRFRDEFTFLIVSDASGSLPVTPSVLIQRPRRLIDIATDQVRSLRARGLIGRFNRSPGSGVYLRIGRAATYLLTEAGIADAEIGPVAGECLSDRDARAAAAEGTHLKRLSEATFDRLCRHGWEVADCTLRSRCPELFQHRLWREVDRGW